MTISLQGLIELQADECGTAWLVLLTLDHPSFNGVPIRLTSDAVITTSRNNIFSPFPFIIHLPDSSEGKIPEAQLVIDNTTLEIISRLRALESPLSVTIDIVRSTDTDFIERQWSGLSLINSTYDVGTITGKLTIEDLGNEEFGMTFDRRFRGLFS